MDGSRFRCIKDLIFHIAEVEDGWTNGDLRGRDMIQNQITPLRDGGPDFSQFPLVQLLDYWRQVEQSTLAYLATLTEAGLREAVRVEDWPDKQLTVDGILSHVLIHEMRHTAQIAVLLRTQKIKPPSLDLLFYLPLSSPRRQHGQPTRQ